MKSLNPPTIAAPFAAYSHGVSKDFGDHVLVLTSGQLGVEMDGSIPEDAEAQAELCFRNIDAILAEVGGSARDCLRINAFVTDRAHMKGYMAARDRWLEGCSPLAASTLVIVSGFTKPEFKVEVEVTAAVPKSGGD